MHIDKTWTLFLDRDGVINRHLPNEYVTQWSEFEFVKGSAEAIAILSKCWQDCRRDQSTGRREGIDEQTDLRGDSFQHV